MSNGFLRHVFQVVQLFIISLHMKLNKLLKDKLSMTEINVSFMFNFKVIRSMSKSRLILKWTECRRMGTNIQNSILNNMKTRSLSLIRSCLVVVLILFPIFNRLKHLWLSPKKSFDMLGRFVYMNNNICIIICFQNFEIWWESNLIGTYMKYFWFKSNIFNGNLFHNSFFKTIQEHSKWTKYN